MISVKTNLDQMGYDIHSLVKAFYPESEVKVYVEGTKDISSDEDLPSLFFDWRENSVELKLRPAIRENSEELREKISWKAGEERPKIKNDLKRMIYRVLSEYTREQLPWGTLTGIRPTKIAMGMLKEGKSKEEIFAYMQDTYYASKEKSLLSIDIAERENRILSGIHVEKGYSLYIGIPFCPTTCLYCSFTSYPICSWKNKVADYLDALEKEIDYTAEAFKDHYLDSVYIGGGTPTTLEAEELDRLLGKLRASFDFTHVKEFTVEGGRADSITVEKLAALKRHGVTRISVNPQTMNQKTLDAIGRRHTVEQVRDAFWMARAQGFDNINMDLILGLPGEEIGEVQHTLDEVRELSPDSLTVHSLAIKRASKLNQWVKEKGISMLHNTDFTMQIADETARSLGMAPYYLYRQKNMSGNFENIGYAKEDCPGIYNILIMEEVETIVALGAGTVTKRVYGNGRIERCDTVKDVALYIRQIDEMIERKKQLFAD